MADLNQVFLLGNLTRDPEVRYAPSGDAVADMHMAVSRRYRSRDGQDREETCFVSVVVWGRQAEPCGRYLHKGSLVLVDGRLQYDQWEKDGQRQSRLRVRANRVQFMDRPDSGGGGGGGGGGDGGGGRETRRQEAPPAPAYGGNDEPAGPAESFGDDDNLPF
jgi:single-strand DNA-binding protein